MHHVKQPAHKAIASEARWYTRAVIYEVPVKSFFDGNNDGSAQVTVSGGGMQG